MKRFAQFVSLILVFAIVMAVPAYAAESRESAYFAKSSVYLWPTTGNTFEAWFEVTGTGTMQKIGANFIKIQRSSDNSNWTTVKTYSKNDYSNLIDSNSTSHSDYVTYTGTSGYYYRAYIELYAKNSTGSGSVDEYTASIYIN